jgi:hypothetical protein
MTNTLKRKLLIILLYITPILIFTLLARTVTGLLVSAGCMTILLGLCFRFISEYVGNKKDKNNNGFIFITISGVLLIVLAYM